MELTYLVCASTRCWLTLQPVIFRMSSQFHTLMHFWFSSHIFHLNQFRRSSCHSSNYVTYRRELHIKSPFIWPSLFVFSFSLGDKHANHGVFRDFPEVYIKANNLYVLDRTGRGYQPKRMGNCFRCQIFL